jgi:hypothetical protein
MLVPDVEVVAADPPVGLLKGVAGRTRLAIGPAPVIATEDPLELLRHPDRDHLGVAVTGSGLQVGPHHLGLALVLVKPHHRDGVGRGEAGHRAAEPLPDRPNNADEGIGLPRCPVSNPTTCPPTCRLGT